MATPIEAIPEPARTAWLRLRRELKTILGVDLAAIWAYGGTTAPGGPAGSADLDTCVIIRRAPDASTARAIADAHAAISAETGTAWDHWYLLEADAPNSDVPHHALEPDRRDTMWAVNRAHWLAGRYTRVHGPDPSEIVAPPTWLEIEVALEREVEHLEAHVAAGDTYPYEAVYALLNGSRILHALDTGNVAISKREAGHWALDHLPTEWHPAIAAALRAYGTDPSAEDAARIATDMARFVAMVRQRFPTPASRPADSLSRWSGS